MKQLCLFICGLLLFMSCKDENLVIPIIPEEPTDILILTEKENGGHFDLKVEEMVKVVLQENPTTGYRWEIAEVDEDILSLKGETFIPDEREEIEGAGGKKQWIFETVNPGSTVLKIIYKRSWETEAIKEFTVNLDVS